MGLFGSKKSFQYVAGVTPQGKPVMATINIGKRKGECAAGPHGCEQHQSLRNWEIRREWVGRELTSDEIADQYGWMKKPEDMEVSHPLSVEDYVNYERENNPGFVIENNEEEN